MNTYIESAIVANLKAKFPSSRVFTGKVIQGVQADDIIVNCVYDTINLTRGARYWQRESSISVTFVSPTSPTVKDDLIVCLQSFVANGYTHYPDNLILDEEDDSVHVMIELSHVEY